MGRSGPTPRSGAAGSHLRVWRLGCGLDDSRSTWCLDAISPGPAEDGLYSAYRYSGGSVEFPEHKVTGVLCALRPRVSDWYTDLRTLSFTYIPSPSGHEPGSRAYTTTDGERITEEYDIMTFLISWRLASVGGTLSADTTLVSRDGARGSGVFTGSKLKARNGAIKSTARLAASGAPTL